MYDLSNLEIRKKQEEVLQKIRRESAEIVQRNLMKTKRGEIGIAVTEVGYDDVGSVLTKLDYAYSVVTDNDLTNYGALEKFKILFINCGTGGDPARNKESLRKFVRKGGALYVSDQSAPQISAAFPNIVEFSSGGIAGQSIMADVVDQDLRRIIGSHIRIYFDLSDWIPIQQINRDVHAYLVGTFETNCGHKKDKPILISFKYEAGEVIYTSFHSHKQTSEAEEKLLKFLVLKPVSITSKIPILRLAKDKGLLALEQKDANSLH